LSKSVLVVYRHRKDVGPYARALESAGVHPVLKEARPGLTIGQCAGVLLTGGNDVNPALYGESRSPETQNPDDARDAAESALIDEVVARDVPLLAICRGMQILNVHLGGSLIQHLPGVTRHRIKTEDKALPAHQVVIEPGTLLASIAKRPTWEVNSRHHQAVARLGSGLRVCARDPEDGVIEAIEIPLLRYLLAVQWHPENQAAKDPEQHRLFQSFADAL
jgi:putative glutamine amidotransferase